MTHLYDLVLENGIHKVGIPLENCPKEYEGAPVQHALHVQGPYEWPWIGTLLRNFWAKRKGARLIDLD